MVPVPGAYCMVVSESGRVALSRPLRNERLPFIVSHGRDGSLSAAARRASSALDPCPLLRPGVCGAGTTDYWKISK